MADELRLRACSRWPERAGCDQACLHQIEARPEACRLHSIVATWYAGKSCAECARQIGPIVWHDRPPALLGPDGSTREWKEVAPEELPELVRTHWPLCWSCHNIAGAKKKLEVESSETIAAPKDLTRALLDVKKELRGILDLLGE